MESSQKSGFVRDPRLARLGQTRFNKSASEVLGMFDEQQNRTNPMLKRSGKWSEGTGLSTPTMLGSNRADPFKDKLKAAEEAERNPVKHKPQTYSEHRDKVSKLYDSYLDVDPTRLSDKKKKIY